MNKYLKLTTRDLLMPPVLIPVVLLIGLALWVALRPHLG